MKKHGNGIEKVALNIRHLRQSLGLTQKEFAETVNLKSPGHISGWETGKHVPSLVSIERIKDAHNFDVSASNNFGEGRGDEMMLNEPTSQAVVVSVHQVGSHTFEPQTFPAALLLNLGFAVRNKLIFAKNSGDTMSPEIMANDIIVINSNDKQINVGSIYLFIDAKSSIVRKVVEHEDNAKYLQCINTEYGKKLLSADIEVIGRVIGKISIVSY